MAAGLRHSITADSLDAVVNLRGHGGVIHCVQVDAVCAALNEVAQLPDGVVDTGIVQADRVVLVRGKSYG